MKSAASILCSIILVLAGTNSLACGPFTWYPQDYNLPRIFDVTGTNARRLQSDALFNDWKTLTSAASVSIKDIETVVNAFSMEETKNILSTVKTSNSFVSWILVHNRKDVVDYLVIAKECELARTQHNSRWYYPSKDDGVEMTLEDIRDVCVERAHNNDELSPRYLLQAIRAMNTLGNFDKMGALWEELGNTVPEGIIRDMCLGHISRVWFEQGNTEKAIEEYSKTGDISSVEFCLKRMGKHAGSLDLLEYVARYCPNNDYAPKALQEWFDCQADIGYRWNNVTEQYDDRKIIGREMAERVCSICDLAVANKECQNPAMWLYCKALALELNDRPREAQSVNRQASMAVGTDFIWNSIRVLDIWLDARTAVYDKNYETRLLRDLQWLDGMIVNNLDDEVRRITIEESWRLQNNQSYYYWNDMLKKLLLGQVCPKLIEEGRDVLAIRLANMADNRLLNLVNAFAITGPDICISMTMSEYRQSSWFNKFDYSNGLFELLNHEVKTSSIEKYVSSLDKPVNALESFLDVRGYADKSYFLDVAGTRYIRDCQYSKAVQVLERVTSDYQDRLNTAVYMNRDPFQMVENENGIIYEDYKLNFAKEMSQCDNIVAGSYSSDEKGCAKIKKAIGMRAAASFAWTLSEYSSSNASYWYNSDIFKETDSLAQILIHQGMSMIQDREIKAGELQKLQLRLEVVQNYQGTRACSDILRHCDEYSDYR